MLCVVAKEGAPSGALAARSGVATLASCCDERAAATRTPRAPLSEVVASGGPPCAATATARSSACGAQTVQRAARRGSAAPRASARHDSACIVRATQTAQTHAEMRAVAACVRVDASCGHEAHPGANREGRRAGLAHKFAKMPLAACAHTVRSLLQRLGREQAAVG